MVFPIAVASTNFHATAFLDIGKVWDSLPLRFVIFGTLSYTVSSYIGVVFSLPAVAKITQFTIINEFHFNQRVYGFFSMIIFGAVYFALPRLPAARFQLQQNLSILDLHIWRAPTSLGLFDWWSYSWCSCWPTIIGMVVCCNRFDSAIFPYYKDCFCYSCLLTTCFCCECLEVIFPNPLNLLATGNKEASV